MKLKLFKVVFNGQNGVDVSLHTTAEGAVTAATQIAQTENDLAEVVLHAKQREMAELLGPVEAWPDQNWLDLWAKITDGLTLGVNTISIEAEEVSFTPKVKPMYGFDGEFVGCMDIDRNLPHISPILSTIQRWAYKADDPEPSFNFYCCDSLTDNIPNWVWEELDPIDKARIQSFQRFLAENDVWWVRFPIW